MSSDCTARVQGWKLFTENQLSPVAGHLAYFPDVSDHSKFCVSGSFTRLQKCVRIEILNIIIRGYNALTFTYNVKTSTGYFCALMFYYTTEKLAQATGKNIRNLLIRDVWLDRLYMSS